ncbi:PCNA-associated factor-like [Tubulanus polymorphus]|uniref:PCNA-associated factor-like n=1 Tax=Tubulanus polymorphus TaxID=672921 RepID=UPI003DA46D94
MVRTRGDNSARKAVAAKAPRKALSTPSASCYGESSSPGGKAGKYAGGNPYCPRPTPEWQKPIDMFFQKSDKENTKPNEKTTSDAGATSSKSNSDESSGGSSTTADAAPTSSSASPSKTATKNNIIDDSDED